MKRRKQYTIDDEFLIACLFPEHKTENIAAYLDRSYSSVVQLARRFKLEKSEDFKTSRLSGKIMPGDPTGVSFRFQKGHTPANKGKAMPKHVYERAKHTMFKKGQLPPNTKKDGVITIRKNKKKTPYKWIRIGLAKWIMYHVYVWVKNNGEIPKGKIIVFRDRDTMNCDPSNLIMLDRKEHMARNTIQRYPESVKKTIRTIGKLKRTINDKAKV